MRSGGGLWHRSHPRACQRWGLGLLPAAGRHCCSPLRFSWGSRDCSHGMKCWEVKTRGKKIFKLFQFPGWLNSFSCPCTWSPITGITVSQYLLFISGPVIGYLSPHLHYCQERSSPLAEWEHVWFLRGFLVLLCALSQHLKSWSFRPVVVVGLGCSTALVKCVTGRENVSDFTSWHIIAQLLCF